MTATEDAYDLAVDAMSPMQKMVRVESLLAWTRNLIAREVRRELGEAVGDERIRWEVALRMYDSDPGMAALIREQIARVSA